MKHLPTGTGEAGRHEKPLAGGWSRRALLERLARLILVGPFAWFAYAIARYVTPPRTREAIPDEVEAARTDDPDLVRNGFKIIRFGPDPVIVIRLADGSYRGFSATCTHLGCVVHLEADRSIACNCHGGIYDLAGKNVSGPPPRPLRPYQVRVARTNASGQGVLLVSRA